MIVSSGKNDIKFWKYSELKGLTEKKHIEKAHDGTIRFLKQYNQETLLSCSLDGSLKVWDLKSLKNTKVLRGHRGPVSIVERIPESDLVISGSQDASIRIWNIESEKEVHCIKGHDDWVGALLFLSKDTLVSGGDDGNIKIWDMNKFVVIREVAAASQYEFVNCLRLLPDGRFASCSFDGCIKIWNKDLRRGEVLSTAPIWRFLVSNNRFYVAYAQSRLTDSYLESYTLNSADLLRDFTSDSSIFKRWDTTTSDNMNWIKSITIFPTGSGKHKTLLYGTDSGAIGLLRERDRGVEILKNQHYKQAHEKSVFAMIPLQGSFDPMKYLEMKKDLRERKQYLMNQCVKTKIRFIDGNHILMLQFLYNYV